MSLIESKEVMSRVAKGVGVIVDVREPDEVAQQSVPGAISIPLNQVSARVRELPADKEIYFLCRSGTRSGIACEQVSDLLPKAFSIKGGISSLREVGLISGAVSRVPPLMQQVQIAAGLIILCGFFIKPLWFLVPFVGFGQLLAGTTGFCGMAKLLAKMPWNQHKPAAGGTSCQR